MAPAANPLAFGEHERTALCAPGAALDPVLGLEDLLRLAFEGCAQAHKAIAVGRLGHGIAAIEGLDPVERVRRGGTPIDGARTFRHATGRYGIGQG